MATLYTHQTENIWRTWFFTAMFFILVSSPQILFARGGGGGSGGGGGGGGGFDGGGGFHRSGTSIGDGSFPIALPIFMVGFLIIMFSFAVYNQKKKAEKIKKVVQTAAAQDLIWNESEITRHVSEVFLKFQNDWSTFGVDSMKSYLTESYWKRMVLELNVLKNENRQNLMKNPQLSRVTILDAFDSTDNAKDTFTAQINAQAQDVLLDTETNKELNVDSGVFTEYWDFVREGTEWKLNLIRQATENESLREPAIEDFAKRNNFFYDPDFGWLMMPNKGVIFSQSNFQTSDINNHVIGYYRDKIVELYTFIPNPNSVNYIVAQVTLPIKYNDILVKKKNRFLNSDPSGLRRIKTESNDFEEKFCLWAHPEDQVSSFELLTPNFMEKIYELPFELNIEVVGSFLYFYVEGRNNVDYDKMLEILSWAFDEMKM